MPATPVITIDIDDAQFQAFRKLYDDYTKKVGELPDAFKTASEALNHGAASNAEAISHITQHFGAATDAQKAFIRATQTGNRFLSQTARIAKSISGHIFDAAKMLLRFGGLGGIAGGAALGFGLDALMRSGQTQVLQARGLNASTRQVRSFQSAFGPFAPSGFLNALNNEQSNPSLFPLLAHFTHQSVGTVRSMNTVDLARIVLADARRFAMQNPQGSNERLPNSPEMRALAGAGITQQTLNMLRNMPGDTLPNAGRQYFTMVRELGALGPSFQALRNLQQSLDQAGARIERVLVKDLGDVSPALTQLVGSLSGDAVELVNSVLSKNNLAKIQQGLTDFANFVASGGVQKDIAKFGTALGTLTSDALSAGKVLDAIGHPGRTAARFFHNEASAAKFDAEHLAHAIPRAIGNAQNRANRAVAGGVARTAVHAWDRLRGLPTPEQRARADYDQLHPEIVVRAINNAAHRNGISSALALATATTESGLNPGAVNPNSSARGLFQQLTSMRRAYGVANMFDPAQASNGGTAQLRDARSLALQLEPNATANERRRMAYAIFHMGAPAFMRDWGEMGLVGSARPGVWERSMLLPRDTRAALSNFNVALRNYTGLAALDANPNAATVRDVELAGNRLSMRQIAQIDLRNRGGIDSQEARYLAAIAHNTARPVKVQVTSETPTSSRMAMQSAAAQ